MRSDERQAAWPIRKSRNRIDDGRPTEDGRTADDWTDDWTDDGRTTDGRRTNRGRWTDDEWTGRTKDDSRYWNRSLYLVLLLWQVSRAPLDLADWLGGCAAHVSSGLMGSSGFLAVSGDSCLKAQLASQTGFAVSACFGTQFVSFSCSGSCLVHSFLRGEVLESIGSSGVLAVAGVSFTAGLPDWLPVRYSNTSCQFLAMAVVRCMLWDSVRLVLLLWQLYHAQLGLSDWLRTDVLESIGSCRFLAAAALLCGTWFGTEGRY